MTSVSMQEEASQMRRLALPALQGKRSGEASSLLLNLPPFNRNEVEIMFRNWGAKHQSAGCFLVSHRRSQLRQRTLDIQDRKCNDVAREAAQAVPTLAILACGQPTIRRRKGLLQESDVDALHKWMADELERAGLTSMRCNIALASRASSSDIASPRHGAKPR